MEATRHPALQSVYYMRWAGITRARLLLKLQRPDDALAILTMLEQESRSLRDQAFSAAVNLTSALVHTRLRQPKPAAYRLLTSSAFQITSNRELQAQYYFGAGVIAAEVGSPMADYLQDRARRVWAKQGVVAVQNEFSTPAQRPCPDAGSGAMDTASPVNALAAAIDVAYNPSLLGAELLQAINALGCADVASIVGRRTQPEEAPEAGTLYLGVHERRHLRLSCSVPDDPAKAILLADVLRIGRAAIALEKARQEERSRAALWPASPAEEQAGALFLAEEMQALLATARRIAPTDVPVLITGETGTGKEVLARMIHAYSTRAAKTFLPFNCSATPKEMLDSQLFGHRRGAFTGANEHFAGVIRAAAGGTLFLDEIGETTLDVQPKLLRFLEASEVHPIGETQPVRVDVRVIAATNADLDALLAAGRFREDLFYRLNIVRLHVPPLRERRVEVPALANHYLQKYALECRKGDLRLAEETMEYLVLYRWPGNVRQLANEMRRLVALAEPGAVLMPEHLANEIAASRRTIPASERVLDANEVVVRLDQPMAAALQHLERAMLKHALAQCQGRIEDTAAMLGVSRKGLYLKRQRYALDAPGPRSAEVA
jgi:DNA-binding NtrC family response regulator